MPDNDAQGPIVDRRVSFHVVERRLQEGGRDLDLVLAQIVGGIDDYRQRAARLREGVVFNRPAQSVQVAAEAEIVEPLSVAIEVVAPDVDARVVDPL